ncbi:MAG: hypothetical protein IT186_03820 [Acidobacteria bacterium]|nr:hypothetical protein [Acidobacteriota bacterium]
MKDAGLSSFFRTWPLESGAAAAGFLGVLIAGIAIEPKQAYAGLLTAGLFGLMLSLGAAVFAAIQGVSGAQWWFPVRGVVSAASATFRLPAAVVLLAVIAGLEMLYPWARPEAAGNHILHMKAIWLNRPLFIARALVVLAGWVGLIALLRERMRAAEAGEEGAQKRFHRMSTAFVLLLGPMISVAFWDWVMSLEPEWFSTMFGVYGFAGTFQGGIAAVTVAALYLDSRGMLEKPLSDSTRHDLGKLLFGFSTFWAYIWFCQYLLIWYSNIPEEVTYYRLRFQGGWAALFWLNAVLNFAVPFVLLLGVKAKKAPALLGQVALLVILGRWLDSFVLVAPSTGPVPPFPVYAIAATALLLGGMAFLFDWAWQGWKTSPQAEGELPARTVTS